MNETPLIVTFVNNVNAAEKDLITFVDDVCNDRWLLNTQSSINSRDMLFSLYPNIDNAAPYSLRKQLVRIKEEIELFRYRHVIKVVEP